MFSITVPAKPTNIRVDNVKGFIITLVWAKPRTTIKGITDTSTLGYYVNYKNLERKTNRQIQSSTERASLHLKANSRYEIKVRAFKMFDTSLVGQWSDPFKLKTNESGKCCVHLLRPQSQSRLQSLRFVYSRAGLFLP